MTSGSVAAGAAAPGPSRAAAKVPKARSIWWQLHHWCGLKLSLLLSFVLLTGTIATLSLEIDWMLTPALRASPASASPASWGALLESARSAAQGGSVEEIGAPAGRYYAAEALIRTASGERRFVYIDPATAHVRGTGPYLNARRVLRDLHRHLFLPGAFGLPLVTSLSIPMLVLLVTSFVVYKKWWRGFLRWPRAMKRKGDGRRYAGDLHRLAGLWSLWFLAVITVTALWYFAEWAGAEAPEVLPEAEASTAGLDGARLDALIAAAQPRLAGMDLRRIEIDPDKGVLLTGEGTAVLVTEGANAVLLDAPGGQVRAAVRGEDLSLHQRISEAADPLHFGTWGGLITRVIWFLFGILLTALSVTGALIYALRLQRERSWTIATGMWRGMHPFGVPCALALLLGLGLLATRLA